MASRIKGITVEIGGDTTGLEKALKSVNGTIRNTQSQLKDVTKLLKLDPKNTELLSQKQRLLRDAISATKDKLEALKEAQIQAKQQLENGTLGQDKYDALQREIIETEEELRRLQKEAETTTSILSKIDTAGKKMQQVGDNIAGAGKKMLPVTAVITGVGTAAVKTAADFDASIWYTGTKITGTSTTATAFSGSGITAAKIGDMYLNTSTYNTYRCTVAGTAANAKWVYVNNIKGAQGIQGPKGDDGADAITMSVTSSNGVIFKNTAIVTTLTAHVYQAGVELTAAQISALGTIKWYKDGSTTALSTTGPTLNIGAGDVTGKASYTAQLEG